MTTTIFGQTGTYTAEGIIALTDALRVSASVTECKLRGNELGVEGWTIIFNTLRDSPTSKIATWDLYGEKLGPEIAKPLAEYISVTTSVTKILVGGNRLGDQGTNILCYALRNSTTVKELSLYNNSSALMVRRRSLVSCLTARH